MMYDKRITEIERKLSILHNEVTELVNQLFDRADLVSAVREIQDEMKKQNRKLILIHEV
tara:strand:+ start:361 stop:537 length:177 start_codon:yes stop_codon:yes gene_type:complete